MQFGYKENLLGTKDFVSSCLPFTPFGGGIICCKCFIGEKAEGQRMKLPQAHSQQTAKDTCIHCLRSPPPPLQRSGPQRHSPLLSGLGAWVFAAHPPDLSAGFGTAPSFSLWKYRPISWHSTTSCHPAPPSLAVPLLPFFLPFPGPGQSSQAPFLAVLLLHSVL